MNETFLFVFIMTSLLALCLWVNLIHRTFFVELVFIFCLIILIVGIILGLLR